MDRDVTPPRALGTVIVDPSLVLSGFGVGLVDRLAYHHGTPPYVVPLLARLLRESDKSHAVRLIPELSPHLEIDDAKLKRRLERWRVRLRPPSPEPPFRTTTPPRDDRRNPGNGEAGRARDRLRREMDEVFKGMVVPFGLKAGSMSFIDQFFLQQVALAAALFSRGAFVLCRAQPEPAFWTWLNSRRFLSCKHVKDPELGALARERARQWLADRDLQLYCQTGMRFAFVHFVFPDPALFREMDEDSFAGSWAFLVTP